MSQCARRLAWLPPLTCIVSAFNCATAGVHCLQRLLGVTHITRNILVQLLLSTHFALHTLCMHVCWPGLSWSEEELHASGASPTCPFQGPWDFPGSSISTPSKPSNGLLPQQLLAPTVPTNDVEESLPERLTVLVISDAEAAVQLYACGTLPLGDVQFPLVEAPRRSAGKGKHSPGTIMLEV